MITNSSLIFEHTYAIRSYEPDADGTVSITAICDHMQDIASRHAETLGFGFKDLERTGHFWMLARAYVTMDRLPCFGETCHLQTWPSGNERLVAARDFLIHDADGLIGRATSNWVAVDLETRHARNPDEILDSRHIPETDRALTLPGKAIPRLKNGEFTAAITARRSDQDINNHVNSVRYGEFCLEAVPAEWVAKYRCQAVDIQFRNESHAGDMYSAACSEAGPDNGMQTMLHSLHRTEDDKEIVRMRSWWKECQQAVEKRSIPLLSTSLKNIKADTNALFASALMFFRACHSRDFNNLALCCFNRLVSLPPRPTAA